MTALPDVLTFESAAIVAALGALGTAVAKVWPVVRRLARFLDDVHGEPARQGQPARPGWGERLTRIEDGQDDTRRRLERVESGQIATLARVVRVESTTERVRAQTENSHSTNLRDDLDKIDAKVTDLHDQHARLRRKDTP
ncbi:DUF2746 domain-containing protein [Micrococcus luteus]|uniref:DUF2746 domain-containing protein n=1 Tax=Micrococcus luteus TaxID=1270 RepID=UPI00203AC9BB|nr:DUF2746 domain-containing protein [Micrococcus luteus]MCM3577454.1 DUF2746 domain-containing protein [Micrococcus luteus]